ncbi:Lipid droplet-associated hydrolase [Lemmus lemmus]
MISHAGFALAPQDKKILTAPEEPNAQEIEDIYGLNGQIQHKIAFLRAHVPKDVKLILIGHSIGSYFVLRVMKDAPELPVIHSFLLFPTIERIAETPNGRIATPLLCWFRYVLYATGYLVLKPCPEIIKSFIIKKALEKMSFTCEIPLKNLLQPFCLGKRALQSCSPLLAVDVGGEDKMVFFVFQLTFYYGKTDGWCPVRYYEDMKKDFPDGDIRLCEKGISHAFVLGFSQEVAAIVADWMNNKLPKI